MPSNPRQYIHGSVVELCFRLEQGLLLPATPLIREITIGIMARAQYLYPVTLCHYVVMSNHMHLLIVVENPANVPRFVEYIKKESSHAVNRLLDRPRHTVWNRDYDGPIVLDAEKTISRIKYFYTNPQRANLVARIEDYPHLSSWHAMRRGTAEHTVRSYRRTEIPRAISPRWATSTTIVNEMRRKTNRKHTLRISPNAWMNCFESTRYADPTKVRSAIILQVREEEQRLHKQRECSLVGAKKLSSAQMELDYSPKKQGRKMICLGTNKSERSLYISWFRQAAATAAKAVKEWLSGIPAKIPPGFFTPGGGVHASLVPYFAPFPPG